MPVEYVDKLPIAKGRKQDWLKDKCCCKCGSNDDLMIEYADPRLSFALWMWAKPARRERHLAKAKVWCGEHYSERKSEKRLSGMVVAHGMPQMYRRGCRCDECKRAIAKYENDRVRGLVGKVVRA